MHDMMPTSLVAAVAPQTDKFNFRKLHKS